MEETSPLAPIGRGVDRDGELAAGAGDSKGAAWTRIAVVLASSLASWLVAALALGIA